MMPMAPIVRPWDIGRAAAASAFAASTAAAAAAAAAAGQNAGSVVVQAGGDRRKSVGDSPLDALFQMASKTFEGLKAKSGESNYWPKLLEPLR